jgi:hypothetical protein
MCGNGHRARPRVDVGSYLCCCSISSDLTGVSRRDDSPLICISTVAPTVMPQRTTSAQQQFFENEQAEKILVGFCCCGHTLDQRGVWDGEGLYPPSVNAAEQVSGGGLAGPRAPG